MAKAASKNAKVKDLKASAEAKNWTKVIRAVRSPKTGAYTLDGKLHGERLSFNTQGKKLVSANYDNGKKVGKWFYWNGTTLKEVDYNNNAVASVVEWKNKNSF